MTTLNAYAETVQFFIDTNKNGNEKNYSSERMNELKLATRIGGFIFDELFPNKQYNVLSKLLLKLSQTGITKIKASTLAKDADCGLTSVYKAVKSIKKTNEILVARLKSAKKNNGHYIFVDKKHANFKAIMQQVFKLDNKTIEGLTVVHNEVQNEGLKNPIKAVVSRFKLIKKGFKGFKVFKVFKNKPYNNKYIYNNSAAIAAIKKSIDQEPKTKSIDDQREMLNVYATNDFQKQFFEIVIDMPFPQFVLDNAYKLALRIGSDCTKKQCFKALAVVKNIILDRIANDSNIVRVFDAAYKNAIDRDENNPLPPKKQLSQSPTRKAPFYNWLEERD